LCVFQIFTSTQMQNGFKKKQLFSGLFLQLLVHRTCSNSSKNKKKKVLF
jgi:hypothetical protein